MAPAPASATASEAAERVPPPGRYRRATSSRRRVTVVATVCALVAAIGLGWVAWGMLQPRAQGEVTLFEAVDDDTVEMTLEVTRPVGTTAVCTIEALGGGFGQVGLIDVTVEVAQTQVTRMYVTMATSEAATVATVRGCRLL